MRVASWWVVFSRLAPHVAYHCLQSGSRCHILQMLWPCRRRSRYCRLVSFCGCGMYPDTCPAACMVARVVVSAQWMQDNVLWPTATLGLASDQLRVSVSHALIVAWVMTGALLLVALALVREPVRHAVS